MKINKSPNVRITDQQAHSHADYFGISVHVFDGSSFESNNIFLYDLCHYMVFSLGEFQASILTFITHGPAQVSKIDTLLTYGLSPYALFFLSTYQYRYINRYYKEALLLWYMVFKYRYNIQN